MRKRKRIKPVLHLIESDGCVNVCYGVSGINKLYAENIKGRNVLKKI